MLRRLLVVGFVWACFSVPAAALRRDGRDLLLPLVRHAGERRSVAALEPEHAPAAGRPVLAVLPCARSLLELRPCRSRPADGRDRRRGHRRGHLVVVGTRLDRRRPAPRRDRGRAAPPPAGGGPRRAVRRPLTRDDPARPQVPRDARRPRRLRLPPARLRGRRLGGAAARGSCVLAALRRNPARRLRGGRPLRRLLHLRLHQLRRRQVHPPLQPGARRASPVRAERRAGLRRRASRRGTRPLRAPQRHDVRQPLDGGARGQAGHRDDHELQRVG